MSGSNASASRSGSMSSEYSRNDDDQASRSGSESSVYSVKEIPSRQAPTRGNEPTSSFEVVQKLRQGPLRVGEVCTLGALLELHFTSVERASLIEVRSALSLP